MVSEDFPVAQANFEVIALVSGCYTEYDHRPGQCMCGIVICSSVMALTINAIAPAHPVRRAMCRFEMIPLEEMEGRPRVDVLCNMSGIFRDSFQNVVELLDDLFQRAAKADEPESLNFIRHAASP